MAQAFRIYVFNNFSYGFGVAFIQTPFLSKWRRFAFIGEDSHTLKFINIRARRRFLNAELHAKQSFIDRC